MNPEDFESPEFDLFKPIIDAFVKKYPGVEHGPNHVIFGDYNLNKFNVNYSERLIMIFM
mgnify:CR=1 FL=1